MKTKTLRMIPALCLMLPCLGSAVAVAENYTVEQSDKAFQPQNLTIKAGDTVEFLNNDPFFHNIFSLSESKFFDLGSFPQGESRSITFENPGKVTVECAIHPQMQMTIEVEE
ncbi:MAG: plastocyanin/azurin family copper-binding protein [Oleiphilaceae bacterium]|nr:plastocyanin/azurin family copper-binding protein [Oleiphilaceae bacterium]